MLQNREIPTIAPSTQPVSGVRPPRPRPRSGFRTQSQSIDPQTSSTHLLADPNTGVPQQIKGKKETKDDQWKSLSLEHFELPDDDFIDQEILEEKIRIGVQKLFDPTSYNTAKILTIKGFPKEE